MTTWFAQFYLGLFGAWLAVKIYNNLVIWWQEGKAEFEVEVIEDSEVETPQSRPWRRIP